MDEVQFTISPPPDSFVLASTVSGGRLPAISTQTYGFSYHPNQHGQRALEYRHSPATKYRSGSAHGWLGPDGGTPGCGAFMSMPRPNPIHSQASRGSP